MHTETNHPSAVPEDADVDATPSSFPLNLSTPHRSDTQDNKPGQGQRERDRVRPTPLPPLRIPSLTDPTNSGSTTPSLPSPTASQLCSCSSSSGGNNGPREFRIKPARVPHQDLQTSSPLSPIAVVRTHDIIIAGGREEGADGDGDVAKKKTKVGGDQEEASARAVDVDVEVDEAEMRSVVQAADRAGALADLRRRMREWFAANGSAEKEGKKEDKGEKVEAPDGAGIRHGTVMDLSVHLKKAASYDADAETVDPDDFERCLKELGFLTTSQDLEALRSSCDTVIHVDNFIRDCAGDMNARRLVLVRFAFQLIDVEGNGIIGVQDIKSKYTTSDHPRVRSGELTAEYVWYELVDYFERRRRFHPRKNGRDVVVVDEKKKPAAEPQVHLLEWEYYYASVSSQIASDEYFETMMFACWPGLKKEYSSTYISARAKRTLAMKFRRLELLTKDRRTFRDALSLAFHRCHQFGDHHLAREELYGVISQIYELAGIGTTSSANAKSISTPLSQQGDERQQQRSLDEATFETIHRRVSREVNNRARTPTEYETAICDALRKECRFLEYQIFAVIAK